MPALSGVLAAIPTPFDAAGAVALHAVGPLLDHVAGLGCHGALLAGSTGEGPSLALDERVALAAAAAAWRAARPADAPPFTLLSGSSVPAWPDAAAATAAVIAAGADAAVVLPPYYFKSVADDGLYDWFRRVIDGAGDRLASAGGGSAYILLYDIPRHTGVPIPTSVLVRLREAYGEGGPFVGLKDSTGDAALTTMRVAALPGAAVFTGTDTHLSGVLGAGGAGAITALASIRGDLARRVWDANNGDEHAAAATAHAELGSAQALLDGARAALDAWPVISALKSVLGARLGGDAWSVRAPLIDLNEAERARVAATFAAIAVPIGPASSSSGNHGSRSTR